jgi:HNH endonuclease
MRRRAGLRASGITRRARLVGRSAKRKALQAALVVFRNEILTRDDHRCRYCRDRRSALDVHHVVKRSQDPGGLLEHDNAVTLCRICHEWTDAAYASRTGRLVIDKLGRGLFVFSVVHAANKFQVRATAGATALLRV